MLMVKSYPDGAKLYLDEELEGPTNVSISNISSGFHSVRIVKDGYFEYKKQIEVFEELVTVVEALLIPLSPSLSPLTYSGVQNMSVSPSGEMAVFASYGDGEPGGVWRLPLVSGPNLLASDATGIAFSRAESFEWSPNESEVLVKVGAQYYLLSTNMPNLSFNPVEAEPILRTWSLSEKEREGVWVKKLDIPSSMAKIATGSSALWAPNKKRFLYQAYDIELETLQEHTYSLLDPMPVGVRENYISAEYRKGENVSVFWYGDSDHLVVVENKKIYLVEIDGSNKTLVYSGSFDPKYVFARPGGGGVIILTRFNEDAPHNLYLVGV
jgi:hypothetical protein